MADFEEVIRFLADKKDVTKVLGQLKTEVPAAMKTIKTQAGNILKGVGTAEFDALIKKVRAFNELVSQQTRLYKELQAAKKNASIVSGNIIPEFDNRKGQAGTLTSPNISSPLNQKIREDFKAVEAEEQQSFERRLRNKLKYQRKQKELERKLRIDSARNAEITTQKRIAEERKKQEKLFKEQQRGIRKRIAALRSASAREIKEAQKTANSVALARRSRASRGLRIGAGLAGAAGNFRVASGLFTASTAIQGLPLDDFKQGGSLISTLGKQALAATPAILGFGAALGGIAASVFSVKEGLRLEKEIAKLSTLFTEAALSGVPLNQALEDTQQLAVELATTFNIDLTDAVEGFKTALSAGIDFPDLADFSREATTLAQALEVSFSEATDILTTLRDSYKLSIGDLEKVNNILFRTIDEGKITVGDLSTNLGRVASVASTAGVNIEELFGLLTFATRQGLKSSRAITSVAKFIESVVDPTDKAKKVFRELGLEFGQTAIEGDKLSSFITELSAKTGGRLDLLSQLFPQDRALRIAASLATSADAAKDFIGFVSEAGAETKDAADAATRALDSVAVRYERVVKAIRGQAAIEGINLLELLVPDPENFQRTLDDIRLQTSGVFNGINSLISAAKNIGGGLLKGNPLEQVIATSQGVDEYTSDVQRLNEAYAENAFAIAKAATAQGRYNDAAQTLVDAEQFDSLETALKFVMQVSDGLQLDKNIGALEKVGEAIKSELVESLDNAVNAAAAFTKQLSDLEAQAATIRRGEAEDGLLPIEKEELKAIDLELQKLGNTADQQIARLGLRVTQTVADRINGFKKLLENAFEDAGGGLSTEGIESFVDSIRNIVGDTEDIQKLEQKLAEIAAERNKGGNTVALQQRVEELSKIIQAFDFGDIAADLFSRDSFDPKKILELIPEGGQREFAKIYIRDIQEVFDAIETAQTDLNSLLDTGLDRGASGVEVYKEQEKLLKQLKVEQDKLNESKKTELDFSRLTTKEIEARLQQLDQLESQTLGQAQSNAAAGRTDAAERNFKLLADIRETREALRKAGDDRLKSVEDVSNKVIELRKKELEEAKKFEKEKTDALRKEAERRKDINAEALQVQRSLESDLFDRILDSQRNDTQRRKLLDEQFNKLIGEADKAVAGGDTEAARGIFDEARDVGSRLTDLDFNNRRRTGVDTAKDVFEQLAALNETIRSTDISQSLDVTEKLNASTAQFSTAVELLNKAMREEGPLVSVDRSQNTYTITINNQRAPDTVVNQAVEEFKRRLAQGTEENTRNQNENIKSVTPPNESSKPAGGAFGT